MYGMMPSDGNPRMNGKHALLSIQQINHNLVALHDSACGPLRPQQDLWARCDSLGFVSLGLTTG